MDGMVRYKEEDLKGYVVHFMERFAVPRDEAQIVADVLVEADRRGVTSHGVVRLSSYYGDRLRQKLIEPVAQISVVHETETCALLDGGNGLGQVVAHHAMALCVRKARSANIAAVAVRNSNHFGIAGYYAMMALQHGMIGVSLTNSQPLVAPTFGRSAMLGTNPIAVAVPASRKMPFVLDMATSTVPIGRIRVYEKTGQSIPFGWAVDSSGAPTCDPGDVLAGGALLPLGGARKRQGTRGTDLPLPSTSSPACCPGRPSGVTSAIRLIREPRGSVTSFLRCRSGRSGRKRISEQTSMHSSRSWQGHQRALGKSASTWLGRRNMRRRRSAKYGGSLSWSRSYGSWSTRATGLGFPSISGRWSEVSSVD